MIATSLRDQLKKKYGDEQVLVCSSSLTKDIPDLFVQGFSKHARKLINNARVFILRYNAEYSQLYTQLIPYVVVTDMRENKLFTVQRISGEERLMGCYQAGAGGHVNYQDVSPNTNIILNAAYRELKEELNVELCEPLRLYGTVRDLQSTTADHLGIVYIAKTKKVETKNIETARGQWFDASDLVKNYDYFESWSRHIIDHCLSVKKISGKMFI